MIEPVLMAVRGFGDGPVHTSLERTLEAHEAFGVQEESSVVAYVTELPDSQAWIDVRDSREDGARSERYRVSSNIGFDTLLERLYDRVLAQRLSLRIGTASSAASIEVVPIGAEGDPLDRAELCETEYGAAHPFNRVELDPAPTSPFIGIRLTNKTSVPSEYFAFEVDGSGKQTAVERPRNGETPRLLGGQNACLVITRPRVGLTLRLVRVTALERSTPLGETVDVAAAELTVPAKN
ncbi:MAG: hypothetical protein AAF517_25085 [Planctomycetota bacterium]